MEARVGLKCWNDIKSYLPIEHSFLHTEKKELWHMINTERSFYVLSHDTKGEKEIGNLIVSSIIYLFTYGYALGV